ncbi:hypothetical protein NQK81_09160 [Amycolatopsis roodepoortensis]|uniref:hypothetical protein n=1 Tax=Amycolatopsis roodepoortensis TaxID=700274 RepID=UPI00214B7DC3|nr:hypothetical protein [Amycolatopsis roodepoortensis]UUV33605.1 hypothetical protein NQK81_09160 [Amycolatopsis roodepoortensis]
MTQPDELAAAVDAPQRQPRAKVRVDWGRSGGFDHPLSDLSTVAESLVIERQISGDLPDECTLIEGYTTATLAATLAGQRADDSRDIARVLTPYRPDSLLRDTDLVDAPLTCDLGLLTASGRELVRQFTGSTRTLTLSATGRSVELAALDPAETLRASVTLPPVAQEEEQHYNTTEWPFQWRINTQWVIDYVLRRNGIFASPPPRPDCMFAMTCHGGLIADVGFNSDFGYGEKLDASVPAFVPGPYGMLAANGTAKLSANMNANAALEFYPSWPGRGHLFEFHCKAGASNTFAPNMNGDILSMSTGVRGISGGTFAVGVTTGGRVVLKVHSNRSLVTTINGPTFAGEAAWHRVGLWFRYTSSPKYTIETCWMVDGTITPIATETVPLISEESSSGGTRVFACTPVPVSCLQISIAAAPPADWGAPHTPQAEIDTGLNWMTGLPDIVNADSFDVLKQAAAAEFGVISYSENGRFRFLNRDTVHALAARPATATLSAAGALTELSLSTSLDSIRNEISLTAVPRLKSMKDVNVYEPATADELEAPMGTSRPIVTFQTRSTFLGNLLSVYPLSTYTNEGYKHFSACRPIRRDTGAEVTTGITVRAMPVSQDRVKLEIQNTNSFALRFALDDRRTPALRLVGNPVINGRPIAHVATHDASIARYGRRVLALPDNPFRQTLDSMQAITTSLLADLAQPTTVLRDIAVVGDPRRRLLDTLHIHDPDGLGGPIAAVVIGSRRTLSTTDGLADTLTLRVRR